MFLPQNLISELETPCVVIDVDIAKKNIEKMQQICDQAHCALRPHIKTHKMPYFAKMQIESGACGISCAKVSEAEVMAEAGIDDIFIAYPMVGSFRIKRALELAKSINRLILAVDSIESAKSLNDAAQEASITLEVRLEIDTGAKRTGAPLNEMLDVAKYIKSLKNLNLTGIYTFKSLVLNSQPTTDNKAAANEEAQLMHKAAISLKEVGIEIADVSAGSTPTGALVAQTGLVNEVRPGTYIFNDYMVYKENAAILDEIAARIYATVVSVPNESYAVIDGGTKTFPMDIIPNSEPYFYSGYAVVEGRDDLSLLRMNEEHGMLTLATSSNSDSLNLSIGETLSLIPIHVCPAINLQNHVYLFDNGKLRKESVAARGMLV